MADVPHIDHILRDWPYEPHSVSVRMAKGQDGRDVIQMRIEMGILQMETSGRPDGHRPGGAETYFAYLSRKARRRGHLIMSEDQCAEVDREFVQFYHRRICWLAMREFGHAVRDADHTLGLMDFCREHSPDENWTMTHEQYRPFVMFHRIQAAALEALEASEPELAVEEVNRGLDELQHMYDHFGIQYGVEEDFEENELVARLVELRESIREKFSVGRTLEEQLQDAVAAEQYERAAELRDRLDERRIRKH